MKKRQLSVGFAGMASVCVSFSFFVLRVEPIFTRMGVVLFTATRS